MIRIRTLAVLCALIPCGAGASGFALTAQDAFGAATASAFSTTRGGYANPAAVAEGWTLGGGLVTSRGTSRFSGSEAGFPVSGNSSADPGRSAFIPFASYAVRINSKLVLNAGLDAPFGLATKYPDDWTGRYSATESSVEAGRVKLGLSYAATEELRLGAMVIAQYAKLGMAQAVDYGALCLMAASAVPALAGDCVGAGLTTIGAAPADGKVKVKLSSTAYGGLIGALWQPHPQFSTGLAYTAPIKHSLSGKIRHSAPAATPVFLTGHPMLQGGSVDSKLTFPGSLAVGVAGEWSGHRFGANLTRTYWSSVDRMEIQLPSGGITGVDFVLRDSNRLSLGADLDAGRGWRMLTGFGYDRSPVRNEHRMPILPDHDRRSVAIGVRSPQFGGGHVTLGWMREFFQANRVDQTTPVTAITGRYRRTQVDTVGVSYTTEWKL